MTGYYALALTNTGRLEITNGQAGRRSRSRARTSVVTGTGTHCGRASGHADRSLKATVESATDGGSPPAGRAPPPGGVAPAYTCVADHKAFRPYANIDGRHARPL